MEVSNDRIREPLLESGLETTDRDITISMIDHEGGDTQRCYPAEAVQSPKASSQSQTEEDQSSQPFIGPQEDAPEYHRYNEHIKHGYRVNYKTWKSTLYSLFQMHNETMNVWTHFLGFLAAFVALIFFLANYQQIDSFQSFNQVVDMGTQELNSWSFVRLSDFDTGFIESQKAGYNVMMLQLNQYIQPYEESSPLALRSQEELKTQTRFAERVSKWPIVAFLLCALFCLGLSATCHLCYVHSEKVCQIVTNLDYWGIALLGLGSAYPYISFKYACGPFVALRFIFTSIITVLMFLCMYFTVQKKYLTPMRRTILFGLFGLSCMVPIFLPFVWQDSDNIMDPWPGPYMLPLYIYMACPLIYIKKIPERWSSIGRFDYFGASHQIFHVCTLAAIYFNHRANVTLYEQRLAFVCPSG